MSDDPTFATALAGMGELMDDALAEVDRLRGLLAPFAQAARFLEPDASDHVVVFSGVCLGDFRRAHAELSREAPHV